MFRNNWFLLIIIILCNVFFESRLSVYAKNEGFTITEEKKKEIEDLRSELRDALDDDSNLEIGKDVIVQPKWLQKNQSEASVSSKVVITKQGLNEVKALREEIGKAVSEDRYIDIVASDNSNHSKTVVKLKQSLAIQQKAMNEINTFLTVSRPNMNDFYEKETELLGLPQLDDSEFSKIIPNVAESYLTLEPDIDLRKLHKLEISKRRTREVLILKSIEEDLSFHLGTDVVSWATIILAGEEYLIGRRHNELLVVHKNLKKYDFKFILSIGEPFYLLETYSYWNLREQFEEGVILVATKKKILWFRLNQTSYVLELYWEWEIGPEVTVIKYFNIDSKDYLAVGLVTIGEIPINILNIYQFNLDLKEFWVVQHLSSQYPVKEISFLDTGRDFILALPQQDTAVIYAYNSKALDVSHLHFQLMRNISSEQIEHITAFKMGGQSYIALGGKKPQVLLYQQGNFISKTILGQNFGIVEVFFPIPVRTYRDDLILLVQHRVDFSTHSLTVLETLIWDGNAFETSVPVPCHLGQHTVFGVGCIIDISRDDGIKGAALLRRGDEISIIVPRYKAESGLFRLNIGLLAKNSELIDLKEIFSFLKEWVQDEDNLINKAVEFLRPAVNVAESVSLNLSMFEILKTPEIFFDGQIQNIYLNNYQWTSQDRNTDLEFVIQSIEDLEADLRNIRYRRAVRSPPFSFDSLEFDLLEVETLIVDHFNNHRFYIQRGELNFDGILNLQDLHVISELKGRVQRELEEQVLSIVEQINFDIINGLPWAIVNGSIIWKNQQISLREVTIGGEAICESKLNVDALNSIEFPMGYLLSSDPTSNVIRAEKKFSNNLNAYAVDTEGLINNKSSLDTISLFDSQSWYGSPTFAYLEITEKFELNGTMQDQTARNFPVNPILDESLNIRAVCLFDNLKINGPLIVKDGFVSNLFSSDLHNVIEKNRKRYNFTNCIGNKFFSNVKLPTNLLLSTEALNNISIHDFIPAHNQQHIRFKYLDAYVYFNNLSILGRYDGSNITDLSLNAIRIDASQDLTDTQLNFANILIGYDVEIKKTLNGIAIPEGIQSCNVSVKGQKVSFKIVKASTIQAPKDIGGKAILNTIDLKEFFFQNNSGVNYSGNIFTKDLVVYKPLKCTELHGIDATLILEFLQEIIDLPEMILSGSVSVGHVIISGDVLLHQLNHNNFDEDIQMTSIWLSRSNFLNTNFVYKENIQINGNLKIIGNFNNANMVEFIEDIIFKKAKTIVLFAPKSFLRNITVKGTITAAAINGVSLDYIANTQYCFCTNSSVQINGNLTTCGIKVTGDINKTLLRDITRFLKFDSTVSNYIVFPKRRIAMKNNLNDLSVFGSINGYSNISIFFENLVYKAKINSLKGVNTFTGRVTIQNGAYIKNLNNDNILNLFQNIALKKEVLPIFITSPIRILKKVEIPHLIVKNSLATDILSECQLTEWINQTLRIDKNLKITDTLVFATWAVDKNNILVSKLNGIDVEEMFILNSTQNLSRSLHFSEIHLAGDFVVKKLINNIDIKNEYENTFLIKGDQHIENTLLLPTLEIVDNLQINISLSSDRNLNDLVQTDEDITLKTPVFFQNLTIKNLKTKYEISGINLNEWLHKMLLESSPLEQTINGNWTIERIIVKTKKYPDYDPFVNYDTNIRKPRAHKSYTLGCQKVKRKFKKRSFHKLKYLEKSFSIKLNFPRNGGKVFTLKESQNNFILINKICNSTLYYWNTSENVYKLLSDFETGPIKDTFVLSNTTCSSDIDFAIVLDKSKQSFCHQKNSSNRNPEMRFFALRNFIVKEVILNESHVPISKVRTRYIEKSSENVNSRSFFKQKYSLPLFYKRTNVKFVLLNNSNKMGFEEYTDEHFKAFMESILTDIDYRLDLEVNITQLSIPETDLYDEHLIEDFIIILNEIKRQKIYPVHILSDYDLRSFDIPTIPAQVLAARTTQIIWPLIMELEEFHSQMKDQFYHNHSLCLEIRTSLGLIINDVLKVMQVQHRHEDESNELMSIITRIRSFQKELQHFNEILHNSSKITKKSPENESLYSLYSNKSNEAFYMNLGRKENPISLYVVPMKQQDNVSGLTDVINFYLSHYNESLFQSIPTTEPKFLLPIQWNNETLLAFVEKNHVVRILIYRGIQGFVDFSKFKLSEKRNVYQLFHVTLPVSGKSRGYLGIVLKQSIHFYEIISFQQKEPSYSSVICF